MQTFKTLVDIINQDFNEDAVGINFIDGDKLEFISYQNLYIEAQKYLHITSCAS